MGTGKIISVQSGKGGVGKTTVALNLAASLASDYNKRVLLVDGNISTPHVHIYLRNIDLSGITLDDIVSGASEVDASGVQKVRDMYVLPSRGFSDPNKFSYDEYKSTLYSLKPFFDYVILDSSPGIGKEMTSNLAVSDNIIYVAGPHVPDVVDIVRVKNIADGMGKEDTGFVVMNKLRLFGNKVGKREVETVSGLPVVGRVPYDRNVHKCVAMGEPVVYKYPGTRSSIEIRKVAGLVAGASKSKVGLMDKLLSFFM